MYITVVDKKLYIGVLLLVEIYWITISKRNAKLIKTPGENFSHNFYTNWNIFQKYSGIFGKFTSFLRIFHTRILKYSEISLSHPIIFKKYI